MTPPIDGAAGRAWRTLSFPMRTASPFALLAGRWLRADQWIETVHERADAGPVDAIDRSMDDDPAAQPPSEGAGPLNHRSYRICVVRPALDAAALFEAFRTDPNEFSPTSFATFVPDPAPAGLRVGDEVTVNLPGPWNGPVRVAAVEPNRVRLETLDGHMEAGWIEMRTTDLTLDGQPAVEFVIESFARSGDPAFDAIYHLGGIGKLVQTEMWVRVLQRAVEISGGTQRGRFRVATTIYHGADR